MRSLYYRCCWHRVSNLLFSEYRHDSSSAKAVYDPKALFLHAASLPQPFGHWGIFSTAATRRCLGSVSVPVRGVVLSHPLPVIALVSHYLTNKLIGHRPLSKRLATLHRRILTFDDHRGISPPFEGLCPTLRQVTNVLRTRLPLTVLSIATNNDPFDLHALDTPPAFILSQDQTLIRNPQPTWRKVGIKVNRLGFQVPITLLLSKFRLRGPCCSLK